MIPMRFREKMELLIEILYGEILNNSVKYIPNKIWNIIIRNTSILKTSVLHIVIITDIK